MEGQPQKQTSSGWKWFWGIFISLGLIVLVFVGVSFLFFAKSVSSKKDYYLEYKGSGDGKIGVVELNYAIYSSESLIRQFKKFGEDKSIKAILLRIDSPGGGVAASQEMYEIIRRTRDIKPVIVSFGSIAASGGYYAACGGSIIVSNPGTLTGSIGVIAQFISMKDLADKLGIKENTIKSGELKDSGSPLREMNEKDREYFQDVVNDSFEQFFQVVLKERKLNEEELRKIANGRVFTGRQAKDLGLVDTLGTFEDAVKIAADMVGIEGEPMLVRERERKGLLEIFLEGSANNELKEIKEEIKQEFIDAPVLQYKFEN
jgi:protease-4